MTNGEHLAWAVAYATIAICLLAVIVEVVAKYYRRKLKQLKQFDEDKELFDVYIKLTHELDEVVNTGYAGNADLIEAYKNYLEILE